MLRKNYILLITALLLLTGFAQAQDSEFKEDLVKIREAYKTLHNFSCHIRMASYETYSSNIVLDQIEGDYTKQDKQFYFKSDQQEYISTMEFVLMIDHKSKMVSYYPKASYGVAKDQFSASLDSLLASYDKISFADAPAGKKAMIIENKTGRNKQIFFQYDKKTFFVEKITIYMDYSDAPDFNNSNYWSSSSNANKQALKPRMEFEYTNAIFDAAEKKRGVPTGNLSDKKFSKQVHLYRTV